MAVNNTKRYLAVAEKCYEGAICTIFDLVTAKTLPYKKLKQRSTTKAIFVFICWFPMIRSNMGILVAKTAAMFFVGSPELLYRPL